MTLQAEENVFQLPVHYNYYIQSALYRVQDPDFSDFLHNVGFQYGERQFRLFTFSRLMGRYRLLRDEAVIRFEGPVKLVVSSPVIPFCQAVMNTILREDGLRLGRVNLRVVQMATEQQTAGSDSIVVQTLSPITVYSTLFRADGRKYTQYFHPREKDFRELVYQNLQRKLQLIRGPEAAEEVADGPAFDIQPLRVPKMHLVMYKGTVIKGYSGRFRLMGNQALLDVALNAGIGVKGSQGFGCLTKVGSVYRREM
ncbi:MAG: CRISPR-associated endoribonuclease Cas6 [Bacillus thermozeamaize]|uniref:CRISPR-associated endoribonuclease n=1 Tax=Bacillus thermozeamaize TaxID=230954 RepID=A0A1Y3PLF2_9BACI|nr:MAG: CRISPR-associated endoribonuclease Cas6 [Bacillus thermozeamaize]